MISQRSRYVRDSVARVPGPDNVLRSTIVPRIVTPVQFAFTYHMWVDGNRIDLISNAYYHDPTMWWVIADGNPEILIWDDLDSGTMIRIPYV